MPNKILNLRLTKKNRRNKGVLLFNCGFPIEPVPEFVCRVHSGMTKQG